MCAHLTKAPNHHENTFYFKKPFYGKPKRCSELGERGRSKEETTERINGPTSGPFADRRSLQAHGLSRLRQWTKKGGKYRTAFVSDPQPAPKHSYNAKRAGPSSPWLSIIGASYAH